MTNLADDPSRDPSPDASPEASPSIDALFLADYAEAVNGKLYMMGGCFTDIHLEPGAPYRCHLAAALRIPWSHTNRRIPIEGWVESIDGERQQWRMGGMIEAGRPPGAPRGADLVVPLAGPVEVAPDSQGEFHLVLRFGSDQRRVRFRARPRMTIPLPPEPAPG